MEDPMFSVRSEPDALPSSEPQRHAPSTQEIVAEHNSVLSTLARFDETLYDEQGPIPNFPPLRARLDEQGRYIPTPISPQEREARHQAFIRSMKVINEMDQDPPGSDEEFMRGIDSRRPEGSKLFEGYY